MKYRISVQNYTYSAMAQYGSIPPYAVQTVEADSFKIENHVLSLVKDDKVVAAFKDWNNITPEVNQT